MLVMPNEPVPALAAKFVATVVARCPAPLEVRPWRLELTTSFRRAPGSLPLWLEPDIDYSNRVLRIDPTELDGGRPDPGVLLHEVTHLILSDLLAPDGQTPWLAEAVCDYLSCSYLGTPVIHLLSPRVPDLSRSLDHALGYPDDVPSLGQWIDRVSRPLVDSGLAGRYPDLVAALGAAVDALGDGADAPSQHGLGMVLGGLFWRTERIIGAAGTWAAVLAALRADRRPADPRAWVRSYLTEVERYGGTEAGREVWTLAGDRGFAT